MGLRTCVSTLQHTAASPNHVDALGKAAAWLIEPMGMGKEYKVKGVTGGADAEGVWPFVASKIWDKDTMTVQVQHLAHDAWGAGAQGLVGSIGSSSMTSSHIVAGYCIYNVLSYPNCTIAWCSCWPVLGLS
jgi:hypothetical protein